MVPAVITTILLRLAACAIVTWVCWRYLGLIGAVITIPLYAGALATPLYELFAGAYRGTKAMVLADVQGRYRSHRGQAVDVVEDEERQHWVRLRDARRILPGLARDAVLERLFPGRVQALPPSRELRIRADALVEHLRDARDAKGVKFKVWLEHELLSQRDP